MESVATLIEKKKKKRMVVESESVMRGEGEERQKGRKERRRRRRKGRKERKGDSDSLDKQQQQLILIQTRLTESDSSEERGPKFYARPRPFNTTGYYILDLHTGKVVSTLPRTVQDDNCGSMSSVVAMGSKIYIFGSQIYDDHHHVNTNTNTSKLVFSNSLKPTLSYFLDLANPQTSSCWKRVYPPLSADQLQLDGGVAFRGKMYFFRDSYFSCLCEVFDPQLYHWDRIKSPPGGQGGDAGEKVHLRLTPPVLADYKNDRIIVYFNNISTMYAYYPSQDRWECLVEGFFGWFSCHDPVTLADGVIYLHYPKIKGFVEAFDLATKQWLNVQVSPAFADNYQSYLHMRTYNSLFSLGNAILCLLAWTYQDHDPGQPQTTSVHIVQFKVEIVEINDTKEVTVTPLSSKYCHLDSRCHVFRYLPL